MADHNRSSTLAVSALTTGLVASSGLFLYNTLFKKYRPLLAGQILDALKSAMSYGSKSILEALCIVFPHLQSVVKAIYGSEFYKTLFDICQKSARLSGWSVLMSIFFGLWIVSVWLGDVSIIDSFWSIGFLILAAVYHQHEDTNEGFEDRKGLILGTTALWAIRLCFYITWRNRSAGEDYRYNAMRRLVGPKFWWVSLFQTFLFQAGLCFAISQPLLTAQTNGPHRFTVTDLVGSSVWLIGFLFEAIADLQLARFKAQPQNKGKLLTTGLWRYSRHPNYFGNAVMFWGFWLIACSVRNGWLTIYSPMLMTFLLLKVSGVALLEKSLAKRKPGFEDYVRRTSAFFPWLPKTH